MARESGTSHRNEAPTNRRRRPAGFAGVVAIGLALAPCICCGDIFVFGQSEQEVCTGRNVEITGAATCGLYQDPRFDYVIFRVRPVPALASHSTITIALETLNCFAPIVAATYIDDGGATPTEIRLNHDLASECFTDPESRFHFAHFTFSPPVTLGTSTAKLVLSIPRGFMGNWAMALLRANDPTPSPIAAYTSCFIRSASAGCPSDFNCDQEQNMFDYLDFVEAFGAATGRADFNRDGTIDLFDYLDFVEALSSGC